MQFFQVDAFTRQPLTGNPAVAGLGSDGLAEGLLQAIARDPRFTGLQGKQMMRPSQLQVSPEIEGGAPRATRTRGAAIILADGTLRL